MDRAMLGPADVGDQELAGYVASWLGCPTDEVTLIDSRVETVAYDLPAITTAARCWVLGTADVAGEATPYRFFVKHVQSWARSPEFAYVPPEFRDFAEASVPWRTEALIYRSDLAARLPHGLRLPWVAAVNDLDDRSAAIWLEAVPAVAHEWSAGDLARAARLLGRLAGSGRVRELADIGGSFPIRGYVMGRAEIALIPAIRDDAVWEHPMVAPFAGLRDRLRAQVDRLDEYLAFVEGLPQAAAHGDACTNNLLVTEGTDDLTLIDFGFWSAQPVGFDLGQLLVGDIQLGRGEVGDLAAFEAAILPAYVEGLHAEGVEVTLDEVRRAHAIQLLIYVGLSTLPVEDFASEPTETLEAAAERRAAILRFILDLMEQ